MSYPKPCHVSGMTNLSNGMQCLLISQAMLTTMRFRPWPEPFSQTGMVSTIGLNGHAALGKTSQPLPYSGS